LPSTRRAGRCTRRATSSSPGRARGELSPGPLALLPASENDDDADHRHDRNRRDESARGYVREPIALAHPSFVMSKLSIPQPLARPDTPQRTDAAGSSIVVERCGSLKTLK
jgi:hypothetical protein